MNTPLSLTTQSNKSLRLLGWTLGILFILKSSDFFLSVNLTTDSELSPVILEAILFFMSGVAMLLLAIGTIRLVRWVRMPLYLVFVSNVLFIIYSTLLVPNWLDASISVVGAMLLFFYLKKSRTLVTGRRLIGLQILTTLTLLPGTIFLLLSVIFTDQALQDDSAMRLAMVEPINDSDNLYISLTNLGDELPPAAETADKLVSEYPSSWDQTTTNQLLQKLQPNINAYKTATKQEYQCPTSINNFSIEAQSCELNLLRDYAQMMQFAAITEAGRGNVITAENYAMAPVEVGLTILQSTNVTLPEYAVGLASLTIGLETIETLLEEDLLSPVTVEQQLADVSVPTESLRTPLQREYLALRITLDKNFSSSQSYFYHPNRTKNKLFTFMSQVIEDGTATCRAREPDISLTQELTNYVESLQTNALNPARPNMIGTMYLSKTLAPLNKMRENVCKASEQINQLTS